MNKTERTILHMATRVLMDIPPARDDSVRGAIEYSNEIRDAIVRFNMIVSYLLEGDESEAQHALHRLQETTGQVPMHKYISIPRDSDGTQPANSWWINRLADGRYQVITRCPNGHIGSLDAHRIAGDGTVSPSVVCQHPGCSFHEFIRLDGWEGGE